jgi:HK97 family phage major capsid protein
MTITEMIAKRKELLAVAAAVGEEGQSEDGVTDERLAEGQAALEQAETFKVDIEAAEARRSQGEALLTGAAEASKWDKQPQKQISAPALLTNQDPPEKVASEPGEFASLGERLMAVRNAQSQHPTEWDQRLLPQGAISGAGETIGSDGGFLVGTDEASGLLEQMYANNQILTGGDGYSGPMRVPISANSNSVKFKALAQTSRADGSRLGGIQASWIEEAGTKPDTKPTFRQLELSLKKLVGLYYATDELLQDSAALESMVLGWFAQEFAFKVQDSLINGTGAGVPLGILNAPSLVTVAKETGQTAATIVKENIDKMWSRMWPQGIGNSVWLINQQVYPQLFSLSQAVGTGGAPVYLPPGGLSASPFGTLLGRPVVPIEQCQALGTKGDIFFCDWSQMMFADKGGIQSASSIHVKFVNDETAFRFVYRCDAQPIWASALTPFKGGSSATIGPFISLATRS